MAATSRTCMATARTCMITTIRPRVAIDFILRPQSARAGRRELSGDDGLCLALRWLCQVALLTRACWSQTQSRGHMIRLGGPMRMTVTGLVHLRLDRGMREYVRTSDASCDLNLVAKLDLLRLALAFAGSLDRREWSVGAVGRDFPRAKTSRRRRW